MKDFFIILFVVFLFIGTLIGDYYFYQTLIEIWNTNLLTVHNVCNLIAGLCSMVFSIGFIQAAIKDIKI